MSLLKKFAALRPGFLLYIASLLFISFVAGAASYHYRVGPGLWLLYAFRGADASKEKTLSQSDKPAEIKLVRRMVTRHLPSHAFNGVTLVSNGFLSKAVLIDMQGQVLHRWSRPFSETWKHASHLASPVTDDSVFWQRVHVFPNGDLLALYTAVGDTPYGYGLAKLDKDSNVLWTYNQPAHHDFSLDESGNIYTLTQDITREFEPGFDALLPPLLQDYIVKLSPEGKEQARVGVLEAFGNSPYREMIKFTGEWERSGDYLHTNTAAVLKEGVKYSLPGIKPRQVLISLRNQSIIAIMDLEKRSIVWASRGPWRMQHQPEFLPGGNIMMFDNQGIYSPFVTPAFQRSRVIKYNPSTKTIFWSFTGEPGISNLNSWDRSMQQLLPNNNILITESRAGRLLEVTPQGRVVWMYREMFTHSKRPDDFYITGARRYDRAKLTFLQ